MNNCPRCDEKMIWQSDFMCDEVHGCSCEEGIVSLWICSSCNTEVTVKTDCKGEE